MMEHSMKLPAVLYGHTRKTRREAKKVIAQLLAGRSIVETIDDFGGLVDVADHPGLIILDYTQVGGEHFHLYQVLRLLRDHHWDIVVGPLNDALFDALVETDWGVAMMMCSAGRVFFLGHEVTTAKRRHRRFLEAAVRRWPAFEGVGARWAWTGHTPPGRPLEVSDNLNHVLQWCDIDHHTIVADAHLGLPELLRRHPPAPERYVAPTPTVQVLRTDEDKHEAARERNVDCYRQLVEDFAFTPRQLVEALRITDEQVRAEGFDPAELDPYWHQRPSES